MFLLGICCVSTGTLSPPGHLDSVRLLPSQNVCCSAPHSKTSSLLKTPLNVLSYARTFNDNSWSTSSLYVTYQIMANKACVLVTTCWRLKNLLHAGFSSVIFLNLSFEFLAEVLMRIRYCGMWHHLDWYIRTNFFKELAASILRFEM
jgi:hypothetical protein